MGGKVLGEPGWKRRSFHLWLPQGILLVEAVRGFVVQRLKPRATCGQSLNLVEHLTDTAEDPEALLL